VSGNANAAKTYLTSVRVATSGGVSLLLGKINVQALPKLAGSKGVIAVSPIDFKQTGKPLGVPDPELNRRPSEKVLDEALQGLYDKEVPYSEAPPLAGSNFEELKELALLDARTHNFVEAWEAGYTGAGTTVGVMDGGTDFGHPDLIGTWQVWSGQTGGRAGWNGWPKAFDPFGTLQWLAAPTQVDQGLSWYVKTAAATCPDWANKAPQASCPVKFSTKTGPSRNFGRSSTRTNSRPASRSRATSGSAAIPTTTCSACSASGSRSW
jgi:subtilisin family serine protease